MRPLLLNLVLLLIAGTFASSSIGKLPNESKNEESGLGIVDGKKVPITKYPFMVAIEDNEYVCQGSGVILNENYILTTAYTTDYYYEFRAGSNRWSKGGQVINTTSVLIHPLYKEYHWYYNVALYKTEKPIKFNKKIQPVEIGTKNLTTGTQGTVVGWGDKAPYSDPSNVLREAENTVTDFKDCIAMYSTNVDYTNFCSKVEEAGPCVGDYGDPFLVDGKVCGLYAGGATCNTLPRIYVNIPALADWIKENSKS